MCTESALAEGSLASALVIVGDASWTSSVLAPCSFPHLLPTPPLVIIKCPPWQGTLVGQGACRYYLWPFCFPLFCTDDCGLGPGTELDKDGFVICMDINMD